MLGEDGLGYELATRLQAQGVWRTWLGDKGFASLQPHLASPASWASFMRPSSSTPSSPSSSLSIPEQHKRLLLFLQMRVRALLFDKASVSLFLDSSPPPAALDRSYMQLYPDSVYFSLEQDITDWSRLQAEGSPTISSLQTKFGADVMSCDLSVEDGEESVIAIVADNRQKKVIRVMKQSSIQNFKPQGQKVKRLHSSSVAERLDLSFAKLPESSSEAFSVNIEDLWYHKWYEKNLPERMHHLAWRAYQRKIPFKDRESCQRTPEGMASYIASLKKVRKRRRIVKHDWKQLDTSRNHECGSKEVIELDDDACESMGEENLAFLPELMFPWDTVPDSPVPSKDCIIELNAHESMHRKSAELPKDNLGISLVQREVSFSSPFSRGFLPQKKGLSQEQADHLIQKVILDIVASTGFQALKEGAKENLSRLFVCHMQKLGSSLRLVVDSYQNQCSQKELLKMFIRSSGCGDLAELLHHLKVQHMSLKTHVQPSGQVQAAQVYSVVKQVTPLINPQQMRLSSAQQLQQFRNRQLTSLKGNIIGRKEKLTADHVKPETVLEPFGPTEAKSLLQSVSLFQPQQLSPWQQQQQMMHMPSLHHPYTMQQMKQFSSSFTLSSQNTLLGKDTLESKMPHVKLEGLNELIGNGSSVNPESEEDKDALIGSPTRRRQL